MKPQTAPDNYQASDDANTLQRHAEITADPKRHAAAHKHLKKKAKDAKAAVDNSRQTLEAKTAGRLKKTFAPSQD